METTTNNTKTIIHDIPPYLKVYNDGTIERLIGTESTPPSLDPLTHVTSKDVIVFPHTSARLYLPSSAAAGGAHKLPLVIYFHGGAFLISSTSDPKYHHMLNSFVNAAQIVLVSVDYRRAPESPLPTAYEDCWAALNWARNGPETWLTHYADFDKVFLAGDSAGANISHHMAIRAGPENRAGFKINGLLLVHPYFWGESPIGVEAESPVFKGVVDKWWLFVSPSDKGCDDPWINPFADGAPDISGLGCGRVLVCVAGNDVLRERGRLYYERLVKSGWGGRGEFYESEGEEHVFHVVLGPGCESAERLIKRCAEFINGE